MEKIEQIKEILSFKTIAVVGFSPNPQRPSHYVSIYMKTNGYNIIPVNPGYEKIADMRCYPDLESIEKDIEIVNIFRRSEHAPPIIQSSINVSAKAIWMQDGVEHENAAKIAKNAGIMVVMNNCILREHKRLNNMRN